MLNVISITDGAGIIIQSYDCHDYGKPVIFDNTGTEISTSLIKNPYLW
jgi:hypothetical protein